jgi:hypothetical protein
MFTCLRLKTTEEAYKKWESWYLAAIDEVRVKVLKEEWWLIVTLVTAPI